MADCVNHKGVKGVYHYCGKNYCEQCKKGMEAARNSVQKVLPKECFITFDGSWKKISGSGCAHWVSHQKGIRQKSGNVCLDGCLFKVSELLKGRTVVAPEKVKVGDLYRFPGMQDHVGLVISVTPAKGPRPDIKIKEFSTPVGQPKICPIGPTLSKGTFYR